MTLPPLDPSPLKLPLPLADLEPLPDQARIAERERLFERLHAQAGALASGPAEALLDGALSLLPQIAELCSSGPPRFPLGPFLHPALDALQRRLFDLPGAPAAWLEALRGLRLAGSRELASPLALHDPFDRRPLASLSPSDAAHWIDAGLMRWSEPDALTRFCERFPGALDAERSDWAIASLPPPRRAGPSLRMEARRFEGSLARAMIAAGSLRRLAPAWIERQPSAARAIEDLLDADAELAQFQRPALFSQDPVYDALRSWSAQRLASKTDFLTVYGDPHAGGNRPRRAPDFPSSLKTLLLSLCSAAAEADAIAQASSPPSAAARKPSL